jgi:Esterase/lipase
MAVLDDETAAFLREMTASPPLDPDTIPIETFRAGMRRFEAVDFDYLEMASVQNLEPDDDRPVPIRTYRPTDSGTLPVLVWAHGGSWVRGSLDSHDRMLRLIARISNAAVVSVDYRLAPEHRYPAPLTDVHQSLQWVAANGDRHGWDTTRLAIGGDSSGASLAAGAALLHRDNVQALSALILLMPVLDLSLSSASWNRIGDGRYLLSRAQLEWAVEKYAPNEPADRAPLSPLHTDSVARLPETLVVVGENDPCRDDGLRFAERLRKEGIPVTVEDYPGLIHHAMLAPKAIRLGQRVIEETAEHVGVLLKTA